MKKKTYIQPVITECRFRPQHFLAASNKTMNVNEESVNSTEVLLGRGGNSWDDDE